LDGAISYQLPSPKPQNPDCPRGEWYCQNPECVVREVRIRCKLHGEGRAVMRCPVCGVLLKFHHWLRTKTLVPYKGDADSA
jgi:aspartate carbamoyltransferase regulatory subunit